MFTDDDLALARAVGVLDEPPVVRITARDVAVALVTLPVAYILLVGVLLLAGGPAWAL